MKINSSLIEGALVSEEAKIVGFKVATPGFTMIVDEWNVDMSYYVIRVVKTSELV